MRDFLGHCCDRASKVGMEQIAKDEGDHRQPGGKGHEGGEQDAMMKMNGVGDAAGLGFSL